MEYDNKIIMGCLLLSSTCSVFIFASEIACLLIWRFGGLFFLGSRMSDDWQYILVTCYQPHELDFRSMRTVNFGENFSSVKYKANSFYLLIKNN